MNIDYLKNTIIPQRAHEIAIGENDMTNQPIYVVLDKEEHFISGHSDITSVTSYCNNNMTFGYVDLTLDSEDRTFETEDEFMRKPFEVTRFYTNRFKAFFLTKKSAKEYLKYQKHNLTDAFIYTFYSGYANKEMDQLLQGK